MEGGFPGRGWERGLHLTSYILHLASYTLHLTSCILHLASYILHLASYTLHLASDILQLILQLASTWLPLASHLRFVPPPKADAARFPEWMHVLRPIIDENDVLNGGESRDGSGGWNGRLHAMRLELRALRQHLAQTISEQARA